VTELEIINLKRNHQQNLAGISQALFKLQSSLINKEKVLDNVILEKEQTIQEQQKVIRRLLKKTNSNNSSDSQNSTLETNNTAKKSSKLNDIKFPDLDPLQVIDNQEKGENMKKRSRKNNERKKKQKRTKEI
jgi:hypothetical protein